ncbi:winged helix-turn-helix domain-containing protein [Streptosporangium sp. NPDC049078]|uniref:winged helix-turn-helix domain-containing protein n=1 Tax=Streptosporangium sp. NPDC049078 TaxID=3155767 RepID=UPI00341C816D
MIKKVGGEIVWATDRARWKQVADELRHRIRDGEYKPRYPIPSLNQLHQEFQVAKNTIRKVVVQLVNEGYVRAEHGVATFVRPKEDWPPAQDDE